MERPILGRSRSSTPEVEVEVEVERGRALPCFFLAIFFCSAGMTHFTQTAAYAAIVPPPLPFKTVIVQITGAMEILFAMGLVLPRWRIIAGLALSLFLLCVLPANIYMAIAGMPLGPVEHPAFLWGRVALQFPLILFILWASGGLTVFKRA